MTVMPLRSTAFACAALLGIGLFSLSSATPDEANAAPEPPVVTPTPQRIASLGEDVPVSRTVTVRVAGERDEPTSELLERVLRDAGAKHVEFTGFDKPSRPGGLTVVLGRLGDERVAAELRRAGGGSKELPAEGYALAIARDTAVLAGTDARGGYYAVQTLRQLVRGQGLASVAVRDHPSMPLRGSVEGFYGSPWTHQERLDQLAFYGDVKMNTYIYTPKDDPYLRDKWREPYPEADLARLAELVEQARAHHVDFTYAVSPGLSICYSDPADVQALQDKLAAVYRLGVRSFSVPLDDISYQEWNCEADRQAYGEPGKEAAGRAQADLLNTLQREFIAKHDGAQPLQSVPTEYASATDTPYKTALRDNLDPAVRLMWTGFGVVPYGVTRDEAQRAEKVWGRKVLLWDNYPVVDFREATGRLPLAPYDKRDAGLHEDLGGITLNPMNQAAASKVALLTAADFSWNDTAYQPARAWRAAADYLSGKDRATTEALLAFFDTQHYAPTNEGGPPWARQAPGLERRIQKFHAMWDRGQRRAAIAELRPYAELLAAASDRIRSGVTDKAFLADAKPWLDALELWGRAFGRTLDGLQARLDDDHDAAYDLLVESTQLCDKASEIQTVPGETKYEGAVRIADGVLDRFLGYPPAPS